MTKQHLYTIFPALLVTMILLQMWAYFTYPNMREATDARYTLEYILGGKATWFYTPQNEFDLNMHKFAQEVDGDLSGGAKVQYIKDTKDGTDLDRYFKINYWMDGFHQNSYDFTPRPDVNKVVDIMKQSDSEYLITYSKVLPTYSLIGIDSTMKKGKLFKLISGELTLVRQYD